MATLQELETALRAADAAGDTEGATTLAAAYRAAQAAPVAAPAPAPAQSMIGRVKDFARGAMRPVMPIASRLLDLSSGDAVQDTKDLAGGAVQGAGEIGSTIARPFESGEENRDRRARLTENVKSIVGANPDAAFYKGGTLGAEIAGTGGVGGALAKPLIGLSKVAPAVAPVVQPVARALESAGMSTGLSPVTKTGQAANMALRMGAGGAVGRVSSGMVDPDAADAGTVVGAALPPALKLAGAAGTGAVNVGRRVLAGNAPADAAAFLRAADIKPDAIDSVRSALGQQGPDLVGGPKSAAQILQEPGVSALDRVLRNAGSKALPEMDAAQNAARLATLDRVAPTANTVQQAAEDFGNTAAPQIRRADQGARQKTSDLFDSVGQLADQSEVAITLPLNEMRGQRARFLGPGTFGMGGTASDALRTAEDIGQRMRPGVEAVKAPVRQGEDLVSALRSLGGIKQDSAGGLAFKGELYDLKQAPGMRAVMQNGRGQSPDTMAQAMHARGFIPDDDPATLLNALREHSAGNKVYAAGSDRRGAMKAGFEAAMGDAPGAEMMPRAVPWAELQSLRSSLSSAARKIENSSAGANKESSALRAMQSDLDQRVADVAAGKGSPDDYFPSDVVKLWQDAIDAKKAQVSTFRQGPQAQLFRNGADGTPVIDDAALAGKFFNPTRAQTSAIANFKKVATPESTEALKSYATTDAAATADRNGTLTNAKYNAWLRARSGATGALFEPGERAALQGVGTDLQRADIGESLGRAKNQSATMQNAEAATRMGNFDAPVMREIAGRVPVIGKYAKAAVEGLAKSSREARIERLGQLMSNPQELEQALRQYQRLNQRTALPAGLTSLAPSIGRIAPLALTSP